MIRKKSDRQTSLPVQPVFAGWCDESAPAFARIGTRAGRRSGHAAIRPKMSVCILLFGGGLTGLAQEQMARFESITNAADDLAVIQARVADQSAPITWVFTGDSITHGASHTHGERSYPEHFAERVRWEMGRRRDVVVNTGISGDTADGILKDFEHRVARFKPDVVSIMIGMNDCAGGSAMRSK